jgi:tRNA wybutosine-synthesizing protein 2
LTPHQTPFQRIKEFLLEEKKLPEKLIFLLPPRWKRVGKVGILELDPKLFPWKRIIGEAYLKFLPEMNTIAYKTGVTIKTTRMPSFEILAGDENTVTLHKELECKFWIDALKLTFSNGNHAERCRMIDISQKNERIIDMFACVGNLSIPLAVHNHTVKVIGIEINPEAYRFLVKNIQINHIEQRYQPLLGDNHEITPENWADRVIMGYFVIDDNQLKTALRSIRQDLGGLIHVHGLSSSRNPIDYQNKIKILIKDSFPHFKIVSSHKYLIKTVAAGINHFVNDFQINVA